MTDDARRFALVRIDFALTILETIAVEDLGYWPRLSVQAARHSCRRAVDELEAEAPTMPVRRAAGEAR